MTSTTLSLLSLIFLSLLSLSLSSSSPHQYQTFIIHISNSHKPHYFTSHHNWYKSLLKSFPSSKLLYTYNHTITGFAATLTESQASKLMLHHAVISIIPDQPRYLHTTRTPKFLGLDANYGIWPDSNYAEDVIIGVLDTGIWPDRESFSDHELTSIPVAWKGICENVHDFPEGTCNKKIIGARTFFKGYEAYMQKPIDESKESKSPRDTEGHGTHTASTAAGSVVENASLYGFAKGVARGMATKARIAAYKICWELGCFDSDILAAMDQAVADGVHVISLSVGATGYAPDYNRDSISIGAFGAFQHGVIVSCSAGNSGPKPYTAVNISPWILTVGASTIDREFPADVVLGDGRVFGGVSLYSGEYEDGELSLIYAGDVENRYCYVGGFKDVEKVEGKIVVCDRGGNARVEKGSAVKSAGGCGMILANTKNEGEELIADSHLLPATMVGAKAGSEIREYVKVAVNPTGTIVFKGTVIGSKAAPKVAAFSSRGPNHLTPEVLKPDVIAPGVNILAAWTGATAPTDLEIDPRRVEFNIISGTSMSCPHVSGLAALLRKAYPDWSPAAIKSALMTTAYNLDNSGMKIDDLASGNKSTPFVHGAGHVNPNKALNPGLVYDIDTSDYISFLCSIGYDYTSIALFIREVPQETLCEEHNLASPGDLNYPSFSVIFEAGKSEVTYKRKVKNVGSNCDAVYDVSVNAPQNVEVKVSPSKLVFSADTQTLYYEITFSSLASVDNQASFGAIEWCDGTHNVRSPIAVQWRLTVPIISGLQEDETYSQ